MMKAVVDLEKELVALNAELHSDLENRHRTGELDSCIDELKDYFIGENIYNTTDEILMKYYADPPLFGLAPGCRTPLIITGQYSSSSN